MAKACSIDGAATATSCSFPPPFSRLPKSLDPIPLTFNPKTPNPTQCAVLIQQCGSWQAATRRRWHGLKSSSTSIATQALSVHTHARTHNADHALSLLAIQVSFRLLTTRVSLSIAHVLCRFRISTLAASHLVSGPISTSTPLWRAHTLCKCAVSTPIL